MFGSHWWIRPLMRERSYFSSMQEHYVGSELLFLFCVCFLFFLFFFSFFLLKRLDCLFGLSLFFMVAICHQGGEDAHRKPMEARYKPSYGATSSHFVFGAEKLAIRGRPKPTLASSSVGEPGCPICGTASLQPNGAAGTLTARNSAPQVSMVFAATVPGSIPPLPNSVEWKFCHRT